MMYVQRSVHTIYKKLLRLYPREFRDQLGESMEQTFNDLCNERKRDINQRYFSFILWTFIETAAGILQEHILLIKEMNPMNKMLTNLRIPALISFLIVLPFMILEFTFNIINRLDTLSLRNTLDFIVVFGVLWLGLTAILFILMPFVRTIRGGTYPIAEPELPQGNTLKNILANPTFAGMISLILALPFVTILSLLMLGIEPSFGSLDSLLNNPNPDQPDIVGSLIVLGTFLLAIAACIIARTPILRSMRAGGSLFAHPINLMFAIAIFSFITMMVGGIIVDQFPCWIGIPNCD